jgi:hypothetical protein
VYFDVALWNDAAELFRMLCCLAPCCIYRRRAACHAKTDVFAIFADPLINRGDILAFIRLGISSYGGISGTAKPSTGIVVNPDVSGLAKLQASIAGLRAAFLPSSAHAATVVINNPVVSALPVADSVMPSASARVELPVAAGAGDRASPSPAAAASDPTDVGGSRGTVPQSEFESPAPSKRQRRI